MHEISNKQRIDRGERSDISVGRGDRLRFDPCGSLTALIKADLTGRPRDQPLSLLKSTVSLELLELPHEPAGWPARQGRGDNSPITRRDVACGSVDESSARSNELLPRDGIVHDIKNLLQAISSGLWAAEVRIRGGRAEEVPQILGKIGEALQRMNDCVRSMQEGTRSVKLGAFAVDIERTLKRLEDSLGWTIGSSCGLSMVIASGLPRISCVESEFENAVLNLVINAREAMPGGGRVTIEVVQCSRSGASDEIIVRVHDTGVGMSTDVAAKAFKPYFTTKGSQGTGVGLAMVASFAKSVGGSAWIEHSSAGGTTVAMRLPGGN
jgi:K+-sensing histidine kinase KdpD